MKKTIWMALLGCTIFPIAVLNTGKASTRQDRFTNPLNGLPKEPGTHRQAISVKGNSITLPGSRVDLNTDGFPRQMQTFSGAAAADPGAPPNELLAEGIHFHFTKKTDGKDIKLVSDGPHYIKQADNKVKWQATCTSEWLQMKITASLKLNGQISYKVIATALQDIDLKEITMHIPFKKEAARYAEGPGKKRIIRPDELEWRWQNAHGNKEATWIGNDSGGLQYTLYDKKNSWNNGNKGGIMIREKGISILANNYTGGRSLKKGETLYLDFSLHITGA